ncbi:hypothetical protein P171DRAFT_277738 [Karstenula rhodostoma CBS 690.94]|uniref:Uncharacterized protein n=1 Tax=Karstenula rhodostoma CBS 690.94 TaxID=1392251 RepID=A0A9P4UE20_9PLEO|nr:hypothetical protein P171DRAFT_277738 [Karstenula rhodostoma CBS 690.94]
MGKDVSGFWKQRATWSLGLPACRLHTPYASSFCFLETPEGTTLHGQQCPPF